MGDFQPSVSGCPRGPPGLLRRKFVGLLESLVRVRGSSSKAFLIHQNFVYYQTPDRPRMGQLLVFLRISQ